MITKVEILIISDSPPNLYLPGKYPQLMISAHPDMGPRQWAALGLALMDLNISGKINQVNIDEIVERSENIHEHK